MLRKIPLYLIIILLVILLYGTLIWNYFWNTYENNEVIQSIVTFKDNENNHYNFSCKVAIRPDEISTGLMFVEDLDIDSGMLFVYDNPSIVSFWMKNVLFPLDIIFIDENFKIVNIEEASVENNISENEDFKRYFSLLPVKYVVEINQGLCKNYGIEKEMYAEINIL